ncbi:MAG: glycosyl hydrolase family 28-related protein [Bergeyella sp.]
MKKFTTLYFIIISALFSAQDIIQMQDQYTGNSISYQSVSVWKDKSAMSDNKADGVIYIKKNGKYYKRLYDGKINVKWFGAVGNGNKNDTEAVQKALNYGESLFFPAGTYLFNADVPYHIEIEGDSGSTFFKAADISKAVLVYKTNQPYWTYAGTISKVQFLSDKQKGIAVAFGQDSVSKKQKSDEYAANVVFRNVLFKGFEKAVFFPFGNIGSNFYDCAFQQNYYGIYSLDNKFGGDIMHAGNKYFYACEFDSNTVSVYVHNVTDGFGGISFTDCIFQANDVNTYFYSNNTYVPVSFTNVWNEKKAGAAAKKINIDSWNGSKVSQIQLDSAAFIFDGSSSTYIFVGGRVSDVNILGKNITVNSYSSNFEYQEGALANVSKINNSNVINLHQPSTTQGIQPSKNIVVKDGFNLADTALKVSPQNPEKRAVILGKRTQAKGGENAFDVDFSSSSVMSGTFSNMQTTVEKNGYTLDKSNRAKILFNSTEQYMSFNNTVSKVSPGFFYLVSVDIKVNSGNPAFFVWDRNYNQMVKFITENDGNYHNYTGYGTFAGNAEIYLDVTSVDGKPVDFNVSGYQLIKFNSLEELKKFQRENLKTSK